MFDDHRQHLVHYCTLQAVPNVSFALSYPLSDEDYQTNGMHVLRICANVSTDLWSHISFEMCGNDLHVL